MEVSDLRPAIVSQRCREIDAELLALRHEQRLFRRLGFGLNIQVMRIVELQAEREECLLALRQWDPKFGREWHSRLPEGLPRQLAKVSALALGLLLCGAQAAVSRAGQRAPLRPVTRRAHATRSMRVHEPRNNLGDAETVPA